MGVYPTSQNVGWNRRSLRDTLEVTLPKGRMISIVDDDQYVRQSLKRLMNSLGYSVSDFPSAAEFLESPALQNTACLIADIQMPGMTGIELYGHLTEAGHAIPTILITAYPDDSAREKALSDGVACYLTKPFRQNDLISCVHSALGEAQPRREP